MSFFTYAKSCLIAIVLIGVVYLVWDYSLSKAALEAKKAEILVLSEKMKEQNKAIENLKLDIKAYKNQKPKIIEKIVTKYNNIKVKDKTCEATLKAIYDTQQVFFNRSKK